jgi:hypothetical protein
MLYAQLVTSLLLSVKIYESDSIALKCFLFHHVPDSRLDVPADLETVLSYSNTIFSLGWEGTRRSSISIYQTALWIGKRRQALALFLL